MIKFLINGTVCPLITDDRILVNKRFLDIENPEQKTADWSQSFLIQNTPEVARLFGQIFEVNLNISNTSTTNFNPDFNPNLKAKCSVLNENTIVFNGYCQLNEIIINKDRLISYQVTAFANLGNFFNEIKNLTLNDVDLSAYNHPWTKTNVENTWSTTPGAGYVYPMIDYGLTTNYDYWATNAFRPAVFVKDIWDKIFQGVGWTYSSSFLTSDRFKRLIIPFTNELFLDAAEISSRNVVAATSGTTYIDSASYWKTDLYNKIPFDDVTGTSGIFSLFNNSTNDFSTTTNTFTATDAGKYVFNVIGSVRLKNVAYSSYQAKIGSGWIGVKVNTDKLYLITKIDFTWTLATAESDYADISVTSLPIHLENGDAVTIVVGKEEFYAGTLYKGSYYYKFISNNPGDIQWQFNSFTFLRITAEPDVVYGDTIDMNAGLPNDIRQTDFISSISKMFNLYMEQTAEKTLLIEPRNDYYLSSVVDWTTKIDLNEVKLIPMGKVNTQRYLFTYEIDADRQNQLYYNAYNEVYGTYKMDVDNDLLPDTKEIKPIFAATPLSNAGNNDRILSDMRFVDQNDAIKQGTAKIRILYWGGLKSCNTWYFRGNETDALSTSSVKSEYPYAGHLDDPYAPTFDLCYGTPYNVYYDNNTRNGATYTYTRNNLYNTYWSQGINSIINKNSKILEGYFYLNIKDYINLDFRKQYFIRDAYYRLLEVVDYDLTGERLVKCRLLKTDFMQPETSESKTVTGGKQVFDAGGRVPTRLPQTRLKDGTIASDRQYEGTGNYNNGQNTMAKGDGIIIPKGADQVFVLGGDSVNILNERAFVFNTDNVDVLRAGALVNNVYLEYKFDQTFEDDFIYSADNSTPQQLLPPLAVNEYYQVNKFFIFITNTGANYENQSGTNDMVLKINGNTVATIIEADWLGINDQYVTTATYTSSIQLGYGVDLEIGGELKSHASADIRIVIYYNIITI